MSLYKGGSAIIDSEFSVGTGRGVAENVFFIIHVILKFLISVEDMNLSFAIFGHIGNVVWVYWVMLFCRWFL